ncbi:MAG: MarR family transcriptional regulator [Dorea sp.]|nr:MarR family transcriptional regulator [Dorea sp.]
MNFDFSASNINTESIGASYYLIGLINRFNNGFQAAADNIFEELSWKQIFFMNCVALFENAPTIKDMADLLGCSHQNAKQILSKLEKQCFVEVFQDPVDKRKQRIVLTENALEFRRRYDQLSEQAMQTLFGNISKEELLTTISVFTRLNKNVDELKGQMEL